MSGIRIVAGEQSIEAMLGIVWRRRDVHTEQRESRLPNGNEQRRHRLESGRKVRKAGLDEITARQTAPLASHAWIIKLRADDGSA